MRHFTWIILVVLFFKFNHCIAQKNVLNFKEEGRTFSVLNDTIVLCTESKIYYLDFNLNEVLDSLEIKHYPYFYTAMQNEEFLITKFGIVKKDGLSTGSKPFDKNQFKFPKECKIKKRTIPTKIINETDSLWIAFKEDVVINLTYSYSKWELNKVYTFEDTYINDIIIKDNFIWIATKKGLIRVNQVDSSEEKIKDIKTNDINKLLIDNDGYIIAVQNERIYKISDSGIVSKVNFCIDYNIEDVFMLEDDILLIHESSFSLFERSSATFSYYNFEKEGDFSIMVNWKFNKEDSSILVLFDSGNFYKINLKDFNTDNCKIKHICDFANDYSGHSNKTFVFKVTPNEYFSLIFDMRDKKDRFIIRKGDKKKRGKLMYDTKNVTNTGRIEPLRTDAEYINVQILTEKNEGYKNSWSFSFKCFY